MNRLVRFPNQSIRLRKDLNNFQNLSHKVRNPTRQMECNSDSKLPRTNTNKAKYPNCRSGKLNPMNRLVRFPNWSSYLRKDLKTFQNLPHRVRNPTRQTKCNFDSKGLRTNTNKARYPNTSMQTTKAKKSTKETGEAYNFRTCRIHDYPPRFFFSSFFSASSETKSHLSQ